MALFGPETTVSCLTASPTLDPQATKETMVPIPYFQHNLCKTNTYTSVIMDFTWRCVPQSAPVTCPQRRKRKKQKIMDRKKAKKKMNMRQTKWSKKMKKKAYNIYHKSWSIDMKKKAFNIYHNKNTMKHSDL